MYKNYTISWRHGQLLKIVLMMKLIALFLSIGMLHVSASSVAQSVTLSKQDASLKEVFDAINAQTGYDFVWSAKTVRNSTRIRVELRDQPLEKALQQVLKDLPLGYEIVDKTIVIKEARSMDGRGGRSDAMPRVSGNGSSLILAFPEVRGKIVDSLGNPLSGASILVLDAQGKRTSLQTQTDKNGEFVLRNVPDDATLEISYIGYVVQRVKASSNVGTISLRETSSALQEVVINKGYYTESKRLSTGNVARVSSKEIEKQPVNNPLASLHGLMPGVYIQQTTGVPGGGFNVLIRGGRNSIRAIGNNPLYVLDGTPIINTDLITYAGQSVFPGAVGNVFNNISPSDIESIEVLKDADATAIYGSRGANGVVLITTKKGKPGRTNIEASVSNGIGKVASKLDLLNREQYLEMRREAFANDGATPQPWDSDLMQWDTTRYTDWQDVLLGGTANFTNSHLSISGGTNHTNFMIRGSYNRETAVFPGDFAFNRGSLQFQLNHTSENEKWNLSLSSILSANKNNLPTEDLTSYAISLAPVAPALYDENGQLNWENSTWTNPLNKLMRPFDSKAKTINLNTGVSYKVIKDVIIKTDVGYSTNRLDEIAVTPISSFNPTIQALVTGQANESNNDAETWIVEPQISYQKSIRNIHKINALIGGTYQKSVSEIRGLSASGFTSDALIKNIQFAPNTTILGNVHNEYKYAALFSRINYNFKDKYVVNLTARRDGSSRFGPGKQFGNFGSVGASWIFTEEDFVKRNLRILSFGKLRFSYGSIGNDQITDYGFLDTYSSTSYPYDNVPGLTPTRLANPDFQWERTNSFEGAFSLGFLENRLTFDASYYRFRTSNQLVGYALPSMTGFSSIQYNLPAVVQNSGLELQFLAHQIGNGKLKWISNINVTVPRNKLVEYPDIEKSSYAMIYKEGEPLFIQHLLNYTNVNPQTGIYDFEDLDGNGSITSPTDNSFNSKVYQQLYGGFQNSFSLSNFQLDIHFQFVKQTGWNYLTTFLTAPGYFGSNQPVWVMDRWRQPGDDTDIQKFTQLFNPIYQAYQNASLNSNKAVSDASFIRLKNVSFSYTLPANVISRLGVNACRFSIDGQNLLTITDYLGLDPENPYRDNSRTLPPLRVVTLGIHVGL